MPYQRCYSRINWENEPSTATPLDETNLNSMDAALYEVDGRTVALESRVTNLEGYEPAAAQSAMAAANSATQSASSATQSASSATSSGSFATLAESYARGGTNTRQGEDVDNAKYYMEQARNAAQEAAGKYSVFDTPADVDTSALNDRELVVIIND